MIEIKVFISCPDDDSFGELPEKLMKEAQEVSSEQDMHGIKINALYWRNSEFYDSDLSLTSQEIIMQKVGQYDLYFGFMKKKYGEYTEEEYQDALSKKDQSENMQNPRVITFCFIRDDNKDPEVDDFKKEVVSEHSIYREVENNEDVIKLFRKKIIECIKTNPILYNEPEEYKIPLTLKDEESYDLFHLSYKRKKLEELIARGKKIFITGSGGSGKSNYLEYIAALYCHKDKTFSPVLIRLKEYNEQSIENTISEKYHFIPQNLLLLLDGLDELTDRTKFLSYLIQYSKKNPDTSIVITSRHIDVSGTEIDKFDKFEMGLLDYSQIEVFCKNEGTPENILKALLHHEDLFSLMRIPFYLVKIVKQMIEIGRLPQNKTEIFESTFQECVKRDKEHYQCTTYHWDDQYRELEIELRKIAFCMVNCNRTVLTGSEIKEIVPETRMREVIKRFTGLIEYKDDNYSFSHTLLRDYFAAKAIEELDIKRLSSLIFYRKSNRIKFIMEPIIPLFFELTSAQNKKKLIRIILKEQPEILVQIYSNALEVGDQEAIFKTIYEKYALTTKYFSHQFINSQRLATIWVTPEREDYLINYIKNPNSDSSMIIESFIFISYRIFDKQAVDKLLIECIRNKQFESLKSQLIVIATYYISLDSLEGETLDSIYLNDKKGTIALLTNYDEAFRYLDDLLDIYFTESKSDPPDSFSDVKMNIEMYFKKCFETGGISRFIKTFLSKLDSDSSLGAMDFINDLAKQAIESKNPDDVFEDMYQLYLFFLEEYGSNDQKKCLREYFISIGKAIEVVKRILEEKKGNNNLLKYELFFDVDNESFIEYACSEFWDSLPEDQQKMLVESVANSSGVSKHREYLKNKGIDVDACNLSNQQQNLHNYEMKTLLDLNFLKQELDRIFSTKNALNSKDIDNIRTDGCHPIINSLFINLQTQKKDISREDAIMMLEEKFELFILDYLYRNCNRRKNQDKPSGNGFDFNITNEVTEWLYRWKNSVIPTLQSQPMSREAIYLWKFCKNGLISLEDSVLVAYLSFDIAYGDFDRIVSSIKDENLLMGRIVHNLNNKEQLPLLSLANHISYCGYNGLSLALDHIYEIFENIETKYYNNDHLKNVCVPAIIKLAEDGSRFEHFISACSLNIFSALCYQLSGSKLGLEGRKKRLRRELKSKNYKRDYNFAYRLCCLGDMKGLKQYIKEIISFRQYRLYYDHLNPFANFSEISSALRMIDLLKFVLKDKNIEVDDRSLGHDLLFGIENIAYKKNRFFKKITGKLRKMTQKYCDAPDIYIVFESIERLKKEFPKRDYKLLSIRESFRIVKE
jgi:energy-coupling factor transporter ATP-binding protein EcfA2